MKLSISNIAWEASQDAQAYELMKKYGFMGLEIAPTRIFPQLPYDRCEEAQAWSRQLEQNFGLLIPSMQSIWYGRNEKLFGSEEERNQLFAYTKQAIDFAAAVSCKNLVFGCPRNRYLPEDVDVTIANGFFRELGDYAANKGVVIGMEANPPIYNTNYINTTKEALALIEAVHSDGFQLNLDIGTMIQNEESCAELEGKVSLISHVHISEPQLRKIEKRELHRQVAAVLHSEGYRGFISIEMGKQEDLKQMEECMKYVREVFGEV